MKRILLVIGMLAASAVLGVRPAAACTCAHPSDPEAFDAATVVFAGTVIAKREPPPRSSPADPDVKVVSSADPATWVFAVQRTYKGEVGDTQEVLSPSFGGSCGLELGPPGTPVLVFATRGEAPSYLFDRPIHDDAVYAHLCGGSRQLEVNERAPASLSGTGATGNGGPLLAAGMLGALVAMSVALRRQPLTLSRQQ